MERISKMWRSGLAMLLALCLLISACPVTAFATDEGTVPAKLNYVSIGDSMANGYGFVGYNQTSNDRNVYDFMTGKGMYGAGAYPLQFEEHLKGLGYDVNHTKLATSAMLAEDLLYLLGGREEFDDGWNGYKDYVGTYSDAEISEHVQKAVTDADVITMGIGNAAFGAFLLHKLTDALGVLGGSLDEDEKVDFEDAISVLELDAEQYDLVMNVYQDLEAKLVEKVPADLAEQYNLQNVVDLMAYTTACYIVNYKLLVEKMLEMNPDMEMVLVGLLNTTYGMNVVDEDGNVILPFGDVMDSLFGVLNAYMAGLPAVMQAMGVAKEAKLYYAEQPAPEFICQVFDDLAAAGWGNIDKGRLSGDTVRDRTIDAYNNPLRTMIGSAMGFNLPAVSLDDIKNYVYDEQGDQYQIGIEFAKQAAAYGTAAAMNQNPNLADYPLVKRYLEKTGDYQFAQTGSKVPEVFAAEIEKEISIAIYCGLEESVAQSIDSMDITLDGLMGIAGDIFGALGPMPEELSGSPGPWTIKNSLVKWFTGTKTGLAMCKVFALFKVGNGMSVHPTPAGHDKIAASVIAAYGNHTAKDETIKNVEVALSALKGFLEEYGPEAAEQAYQYLQENGYIDMARTEIEELVKYLNENKDALVEEMIPMIEAAIEALEAQNEELKAVLKSLKAELEALNAELEKASGEAAEQIKQAIAQIEAAIAEIEALIAQVNKQIAEMNAAVEELIEAAKAIAEQVEVAIENAEALAESIVALVETLKETGTASVEAIAAAVEQARKTVLLAAETLEQAIELVTTQVADAVAMAEKITEQITALYQDVTSTLDEIIAKLPSDVQGAIKGAAEEIQKALDEAIAGVNADLQKAIDELKATIGAEIDAKKAELEALLDKIDAHVEEKAAGIKAAAEAQIAALKAEAEAKISEINKKLEAEIAKLEAAANAQIDEIKGQIEALKAQAEAQIAKIQAEVEAQIAAIEAIIAEKEAQLKDLYAQLENASEEMKAEILKRIAQVEAEIAKLEAQIEALKAQAEAQIAKVKAEVEALNAKIQAIIADTQAQIEDLKAQAEAQIETVKAQLKAAVEKINADLKAKIDAIRAEVEATYANAVAALEKAIADLEEKLNAEIAKLKAQAEAQIAKLKAAAEAELEKLNALGQAAADVVNGIIEQVQDQLNTVNETVKAMMNSSVEEAAKLAEKLAEDLKGLGEEALNALVDELNEVLYDAFVKATTADLGLNEESTYIALGDGTAAPESYVEMLGEKLKAEYGVENIVNYAKDGNTVGDEIKAIADREGIADADLITIGFGNVTLVENAFNNAMKDEPASYNWVELVGEELVPYVQDALADIYAEIAAAGLDEETTEMLNIMVEGIAYGAVEYAIELPALINAIRTVNTDAVVIIVGQYNPMDGVVLEFGGMFGAPLVTLDIADYINYLVDGVAAHGIAYSMITGDAIFVEAPQVDTDNTDMSWGLKDLMQFMVYGFGVLNPSESGDGYITNQILEALNISKIEVKPEEPVKPVNPFVDVPEGAFYYDAVMWAVDLGITTGTQDGTTFEPNSPCTRAHIATFLWRAAGCPEPESTVMPFKDVAEGKFYTTAVLWAAENGITNGTGDGTTFEPNATCTRGQIVTMLARYLKGEPTGNDNPFKDVPANAYYTNPVLWAVENGITNGTQDGTTFEPNSPCTRGHIVTFLYRALNK